MQFFFLVFFLLFKAPFEHLASHTHCACPPDLQSVAVLICNLPVLQCCLYHYQLLLQDKPSLQGSTLKSLRLFACARRSDTLVKHLQTTSSMTKLLFRISKTRHLRRNIIP